ncbi:MAG TPA: hypothetical protein DCS93_24505 [Microscillaceae bacterium]|nr:hypothetical protein [Microscillaceae bacterium]
MKNLAQKLKKVKKPSECHQSDVYSETYHLAKMKANYEKAREELAVQPYSQRMKPLDNFLYGFRSVYHFISVILGLATCVLVSLVFVGADLDGNGQFPAWMLILMALLIGGLLVGILVAVELAKITFAKNIFKAKAKRGRISNLSIVGLSFLVFVSIALSGVGGALLSFKMGDKTKTLTQDLKTNEQKVAKQYDARLKQLNQVIAGLENLSVDKKARRWGLTKEEQANLQQSKAEKRQILAKKEQKLSSLNTKHTAEIKANKDYTSTTMYVALGLITVLELITIYAYFFHFQYLARTEQEGVQFDILSDSGVTEKPQEMMVETLVNRLSDALLTTQSKAQAAPTQDWMQALEQKVAQLTNQVQGTPALATQPHNEISLRPSSMRKQEVTDPRAVNQNAPKGTHVECSNSQCSNTFTKKSKNHKYCSPGCRTNKSFNLS